MVLPRPPELRRDLAVVPAAGELPVRHRGGLSGGLGLSPRLRRPDFHLVPQPFFFLQRRPLLATQST